MKLSVVYYSASGNTKCMAEAIVSGANSVSGVSARAMSITDLDEAYLAESSCVIIGAPTYYTSMCSEMKTWLDKESGKYHLAGKLGGAFATAAYIHGGADLAIQGMLTHLLFSGMIIYSGGGACGNPPIHMGPVAIADSLNQSMELFEIYGKRMALKALGMFQFTYKDFIWQKVW